MIGLANAGGDTTNSIKQAAEFGIDAGGSEARRDCCCSSTTCTALGSRRRRACRSPSRFYWDLNDDTRAWSKRFAAEANKGPDAVDDAGRQLRRPCCIISKALEALGGNPHDGAKVVAKMKEIPTDDPLFGKGPLRADGRRLIPAYLFEVKKPRGIEGAVGLLQADRRDRPEDAAVPLAQSECPLVKK